MHSVSCDSKSEKLEMSLDDIIKTTSKSYNDPKVERKIMLNTSKPHTPINKKWEHDLFSRKGRNQFIERSSSNTRMMNKYTRPVEKKMATNWPYIVMITNLHWETTKEDILKLLASIHECPPVGQVSIIYDKSGRSEGMCRIKIRSMEHANRICSLLGGKEIQGCSIIALIEDPSYVKMES